MQTMRLENGAEVEVQVLPSKGDGYMIVHRKMGTKASYTVTCCCNGQCVSTTCSYPDGTPPSPTCDCTGSSPSLSC